DCGDARARHPRSSLFFFHDTAAAALYTRSLHDALPIFALSLPALAHRVTVFGSTRNMDATSAGVSKGSGSCVRDAIGIPPLLPRSEEHTSELQSRENLVCRLLLEKKKRAVERKRSINSK